jgi:type VI secretion system secreted protein Hcp
MATASIFLKTSEIKGQGAGTYADQVILNSLSFGGSNDTNFHTGVSQNSNSYVFNIDCTKAVDSATATIARECVSGKHLDSVIITVTKPIAGSTNARYEFAVFTLTNVVITNHLVSMSDGGDASESFSLHYGKIQLKVTPQDDKGAKLPDSTWTYEVKTATSSGS